MCPSPFRRGRPLTAQGTAPKPANYTLFVGTSSCVPDHCHGFSMPWTDQMQQRRESFPRPEEAPVKVATLRSSLNRSRTFTAAPRAGPASPEAGHALPPADSPPITRANTNRLSVSRRSASGLLGWNQCCIGWNQCCIRSSMPTSALAAIRNDGRDRAGARAKRRSPGRRDERAPLAGRELDAVTGFSSFQIASPATSLYDAHRAASHGGPVVATAFGAGAVRPGQHDGSVADAATAACRRIPTGRALRGRGARRAIQEAGLSVEKLATLSASTVGTTSEPRCGRRRRSVRSR